jgi:hypothetical protein
MSHPTHYHTPDLLSHQETAKPSSPSPKADLSKQNRSCSPGGVWLPVEKKGSMNEKGDASGLRAAHVDTEGLGGWEMDPVLTDFPHFFFLPRPMELTFPLSNSPSRKMSLLFVELLFPSSSSSPNSTSPFPQQTTLILLSTNRLSRYSITSPNTLLALPSRLFVSRPPLSDLSRLRCSIVA